jgi:hypothetical protein
MTTTDTDTEDTDLKERWVALGTRVAANHARASRWLDQEGGELLFADRTSYVIGATYEVRVKRTGAGRVTMLGKPVFLGRDAQDPARVALWEARALIAEQELSRRSRERNAAKVRALDEALRPLLDIARELRSSSAKDAFAAYVLRRLQFPFTDV